MGTSKGTVPLGEIGLDRGELEHAIREVVVATLGEEEVIDVDVSRFPEEYGAIVQVRHEPSPEAEALAVAHEERFRRAGIRGGIFVLRAKGA